MSEARVDRVFAALGRMTEVDLIAMRAAWDEGDATVREQAWTKVRAVLRDDPRKQIYDEAKDRLAAWLGESNMRWLGGASSTQVVVSSGIEQSDARREVQPAVLDAVAAMLVDEVLEDDEREELLRPLRSVTSG